MTLDIAQLQRSLCYVATGQPKAICVDVAELREFDKLAEKQQKKWGLIALLLPALALLAFFLTAYLGPIGIAIAVVPLVGFIFALSLWLRFKRRNVEDRRYETLHEVLGLLGADLADEPLSVKLDLRPSNHKEKFTHKGEAGTWKVKYYVDPWLRLDGRLLDGTSFALTMTHLHQYRSKWKRSASGKQKHKSKTKDSLAAELQLRFKPRRYDHMATLGPKAEEAIQLPPGIDIKKFKFSDRDLLLRVASKLDWGLRGSGEVDAKQLLAMMFLSLYQVLNLSKAIDKQQRKRGTA